MMPEAVPDDDATPVPRTLDIGGQSFPLRDEMSFGAVRQAAKLQPLAEAARTDSPAAIGAMLDGLADMVARLVDAEHRDAALAALDDAGVAEAEHAVARAIRAVAGVPTPPSSRSGNGPTVTRSNSRAVRLWPDTATAPHGTGPPDAG